jgi:hypothetical protein
MATPRRYTGKKDAPHPRRRPGTTGVYEWLQFLFGLKPLGTYANRDSVHATNRAMDLAGTKDQLHNVISFVYQNRQVLGIEAIHDYAGNYIPNPKGWGAGYRCNRDWGRFFDGWKVYDSNVLGSPNAHWVHIELSPKIADTPRADLDALIVKLLEA